MKTVIIIWVAVVISTIGTITYVNAAIDARVNEDRASYTKSLAETVSVKTVNPQKTMTVTDIQGGQAW